MQLGVPRQVMEIALDGSDGDATSSGQGRIGMPQRLAQERLADVDKIQADVRTGLFCLPIVLLEQVLQQANLLLAVPST